MQVGCGADELIDLLMRCVLDPGDSIIDCPPTFTMYKFDAAVNNANVVTVPRNGDFSINVSGMEFETRWPGVHLSAPQTCKWISHCTDKLLYRIRRCSASHILHGLGTTGQPACSLTVCPELTDQVQLGTCVLFDMFSVAHTLTFQPRESGVILSFA